MYINITACQEKVNVESYLSKNIYKYYLRNAKTVVLNNFAD